MRPILAVSLAALALATLASIPTARAEAPTAAPSSAESAPALAPAPLSRLVRAVDIPYKAFTLKNGLRVLVHTDRKAPVVAISVWYGVGSKHEPKGKTGFAHLFEHLMYNGSENVPGDFFEPLQHVGATDYNGTTWFDRTNYFETVPTGALDLGLMLESDRMGHLLGAVTQEKLDNQRGVVQNEKRQGDNQPYGLVEYEQLENLYPSGHPYHHSTIGSMDDLNSATLEDVKGWFRNNYGPNNAILVLAGDIDLKTAKARVGKWFGDIPRGPAIRPVAVPVPTLEAPKAKKIKDQVATTRIYRMWAIPGLDNPENLPLAVSGLVLGGLASSRLDDALVRRDRLAVSVVADAQVFAQGGQFVVYADVTPGSDAARTAAALDAEIAKILAEGPNADELLRATTAYAAAQIRALETTGGFGGKAPTLAEGLLYNGDPADYRKTLERAAALTPAGTAEVARRWLSRPAFSLTIEPGARTEGGEARGGFLTAPKASAAAPAFWRDPALADTAPAYGGKGVAADRSKLPAVGDLKPLDFPAIERATLSNGMKVLFARRAAVPVVAVRVSFDAGFAADPKSALGTQAMLLRLMNEGTETLDSSALARARERLGAEIAGFADLDTTSFQLDALAPNLDASMALLAEYIRKPALAPAELERVRTQQLAAISAELSDPAQIAARALVPEIYGAAHPYGVPPSGRGEAPVVKRLTRDELAAFHRTWFRPDRAQVFVVGATTLAEVVRLLETRFGNWKAPAAPAPVKVLDTPVPAQAERVILIDRPGSPQSVISAGKVLSARGTDDLLALLSANDILGGNFLGRINMNLRETKGWSYGASTRVSQPLGHSLFRVSAPVQADRTGDSITEIRGEITRFLTSDGVKPDELEWSTNGSARELPGSFETSGDVLGGVASIVTYARPDDYYEQLGNRYHAMTPAALDQAMQGQLGKGGLVWVVVGDAQKVRPQLDALALPVEVRSAPGE